MKQLNQVHAFTDLNRFSEMRSNIASRKDGMAAEVAKEFEALFIEMMLASARKASINSGLFESHALELYREMFDTQAARILAERGALGFEQQISQFLDPSINKESVQQPPGANINTARGAELSVPARRADIAAVSPDVAAPLPVDAGWNRAELFIQPIHRATPVAEPDPSGVQSDFVTRIAPFATKAAAALGTDPTVLIAQAALETGWGRHVIPGADGVSSNNLFGIKATKRWAGPSAEVNTFEFFGNRPIKTKASFRAYPSIDDAFQDYVSFIKDNPRYKQALTVAADPDSYIRELARAGYATDPRYAEKIISIKQKINGEVPITISANKFTSDGAPKTNSMNH